MVMKLRSERLTQFGFLPVDVLEAIQTSYQGADVAQTYEGNRVFDITVILDEASRKAPEEIGSLLLRNSEGLRMPLRELAEVYPVAGRYVVAHEGARRRQQVSCNVAGRDMASFVADMKKRIAQVSFPPGVYLFGGSGLAQSAARQELLLHSAIAGIGIVLLLSIVFGSARNLL